MAFVRDPYCITPIMTSNTAPSGVASASTEYNASFSAYMAMNGAIADGNDCWMTTAGSGTGIIGYQFIAPKIVNKYNLYPKTDSLTRSPKSWTFEGWDGGKWVVVDARRTINSWVNVTKNSFSTNNLFSYLKYRLNITENNGDATLLSIGELELCFDPILHRRNKTRQIHHIHLPSHTLGHELGVR